jgi:hypothetical protein
VAVAATSSALPEVRIYLPTKHDGTPADNGWGIDAGVSTGNISCSYPTTSSALVCSLTKASAAGTGNTVLIKIAGWSSVPTTNYAVRTVLKNPETAHTFKILMELGVVENRVFKVMYSNVGSIFTTLTANSPLTDWTTTPVCGDSTTPTNNRSNKIAFKDTDIGCTVETPVASVSGDPVFLIFPAGWDLTGSVLFTIGSNPPLTNFQILQNDYAPTLFGISGAASLPASS